MASFKDDSPSAPDNGRRLESKPVIDLRLLSQSELYALSLCSNAASNTRRCDDHVIPKIDNSVFNESAGSRKQTYSRIRLSPRKPESSIVNGSSTPQLRDDPERAEDSRIISLLKYLMNGKESVPGCVESDDSVPQVPKMYEVQNQINVPNVVNVVKKRGRGRPRKIDNGLTVVNAGKKRGRPPKNENRLSVVNNVVKKRGRGRPSKNENRLAVVNNVVKKRGRGRLSKNENRLAVVNNVVKKRGRGRLSKNENRLAVVNNVVKKRGRGRPSKNENFLTVVNVVNAVNDVKKRGRGKPKKYENPLEVVIVPNVVNVLKRGRGRPRKIENPLAVVEPVVEMPAVLMVDKTEAAREDDIVDANAVNMDTNILNRDGNTVNLEDPLRSRTREDGHRFSHRRNYCRF